MAARRGHPPVANATDMNVPAAPHPAGATLALLLATFPVFRDGQPLAIGIHKTLRQRLPELKDADLRLALRRHVSSTKYLKAIANGDRRYDLDGQPAGEISAEHKQEALDALKERFRKAAERQRETEQEKQHQAKLQQLADKFNRR